MFATETLEQLMARLKQVEADIAAHPLASEHVKLAQAVVDNADDKDEVEVNRQLTERGLPRLEELGKIVVQGTASWWRLHRDKKRIEKKIGKLSHS
ncbi:MULTISPECIES: hypothetical protein [unclassified Microbacterium]|uniref:hypothetical protein n=1 Tax=unclassified Microbacterium TaxID=2609290 RepID=UPI000EA8CBB8|nr:MULTISPECIES: hypothetical protein [unclassified Microbacterium]MBT2484264.1 hypothetical protein [Microbacterium sp. ISL-108]RKN67187.1 hypothetical protein D7252_06070 [Microbacterium sp. CGR2]